MKRIALLFPLICAAAPATPPARQRIVLLVDEMKAIRNFPVVRACWRSASGTSRESR